MGAVRFIAIRVAVLAATLLAASFVIFGALFLAYPDPIPFLTDGRPISAEAEAALRAQLHLDDPFLVRYGTWLMGIFQGDFGQSVQTGESVASAIWDRSATTLLLVGYAGVLIAVLGLTAGIVAGAGSGVWAAGARGLTRIGLAIPPFVLGPALIAVFAVNLGWFPVFGSGSDLLGRLWHLTLPAISLAVMLAAYLGRIATVAVWEEFDREHVETARAQGLPEGTILRRHVVRNALIPVTTASAVAVASLFAGAVAVESIFGLDGLGSLLLRSVLNGDFPMVQGIVLVITAVLVIVNISLDLVHAAIDPRAGVAA